MSFNLSSENLLLPRTPSEDDISDYEEVLENKNNVLIRIGCQSPLPSSKFMEYINRDKDNYSIVSDLTEYEDKQIFEDDEDEINFKIWPIEYDYDDYEEDFAEGYEECYKDDVSEANGYYSYCSR